MKLPNVERAVVHRAKLVEYLLSVTHRRGRAKAAFFLRYGFTAEAPEHLEQALRQHAADNDVSKIEDTLFGTRYVVEGECLAPDGRAIFIRAVWFFDTGQDVPRFVTAYPLRSTR